MRQIKYYNAPAVNKCFLALVVELPITLIFIAHSNNKFVNATSNKLKTTHLYRNNFQ